MAGLRRLVNLNAQPGRSKSSSSDLIKHQFRVIFIKWIDTINHYHWIITIIINHWWLSIKTSSDFPIDFLIEQISISLTLCFGREILRHVSLWLKSWLHQGLCNVNRTNDFWTLDTNIYHIWNRLSWYRCLFNVGICSRGRCEAALAQAAPVLRS